jgi:site-specific DNA-methyltransferase (adenine-specific)
MLKPYYKSPQRDFNLLQGDCIELLKSFDFKFDTIFADPPYFLSNGGFSVQSGKQVSVNKGDWDKSQGRAYVDDFNYRWLKACRDKLKDKGTIWVSGTYHNIFSVEKQLERLGFKLLNVVTWAKTNPPPNLSCRYFTHSTEFVLWARKYPKVPHYFDYQLMRRSNGDKQMKDVWSLPAIARWEKARGKHPTQKPLNLLCRIVAASTPPGGWVLDPFAGSSTTGIAAVLLGCRFLGIDRELPFLDMGVARYNELQQPGMMEVFRNKIRSIAWTEALVREPAGEFGMPEFCLP